MPINSSKILTDPRNNKGSASIVTVHLNPEQAKRLTSFGDNAEGPKRLDLERDAFLRPLIAKELSEKFSTLPEDQIILVGEATLVTNVSGFLLVVSFVMPNAKE